MQSKSLYIAEKPSVAKEFAKVLNVGGRASDGYLESADAVVTWCVGHLVTMSYPEVYDPKLKKWSLDTLPFLPEEFKYELIDDVKKQFRIVERLLNREDVTCIYVCTDSGREGEYIYRLVDQMAHVGDKDKRRVWIDSQTEEEILRGIREAKPLSEYDHLADAHLPRSRLTMVSRRTPTSSARSACLRLYFSRYVFKFVKSAMLYSFGVHDVEENRAYNGKSNQDTHQAIANEVCCY